MSCRGEWLGRQLGQLPGAPRHDAMCQVINADLGIGVLPRAACAPIVGERGLRAIRIDERWAMRKFGAATEARDLSAPSAQLSLAMTAFDPLERRFGRLLWVDRRPPRSRRRDPKPAVCIGSPRADTQLLQDPAISRPPPCGASRRSARTGIASCSGPDPFG